MVCSSSHWLCHCYTTKESSPTLEWWFVFSPRSSVRWVTSSNPLESWRSGDLCSHRCYCWRRTEPMSRLQNRTFRRPIGILKINPRLNAWNIGRVTTHESELPSYWGRGWRWACVSFNAIAMRSCLFLIKSCNYKPTKRKAGHASTFRSTRTQACFVVCQIVWGLRK